MPKLLEQVRDELHTRQNIVGFSPDTPTFKTKESNGSGFTLIELVLWIAIAGRECVKEAGLAALALPAVQ